MKKRSWELKVGDVLQATWCGPRLIAGFEEYTGPIDFVERIAVFHDGSKMSLEKGYVYEVLEPGETGGIKPKADTRAIESLECLHERCEDCPYWDLFDGCTYNGEEV